jgi:hypothetical protein
MPAGQLLPQLSQLVGILPARYAKARKQAWFLTFDALGVAPAIVKPSTSRVDPNFDFIGVCAYGKLRSNDNLVNKDGNPVLVSITDETGKSYIPNNGFIDFETFFGNAKQPAVLAVPLIVPGPTGLTFTFNNLHNADTINIRTVLAGFMVAKSDLARAAR